MVRGSEHRTGDRGVLGSNPGRTASEFRQFCLSHITSVFPTLSEETLKAVGPFYPVSMPGEVKVPQ